MFRGLLKKGEDSNLPLYVMDPLGSTGTNLFAEPSAPTSGPVLWGDCTGRCWVITGQSHHCCQCRLRLFVFLNPKRQHLLTWQQRD